MVSNENQSLEERARNFLNGVYFSERHFSECFESQPEDIKEFLMGKGYVIKNVGSDISYGITNSGITYVFS